MHSDPAHWDAAYGAKSASDLSWFEDTPRPSLELIARSGQPTTAGIIDIGGGASRLVDHLLDLGYQDISVLDLSGTALASAQARLGPRAERVAWIAADATTWEPGRKFDLWHDRAAFHFLTDPAARKAYLARMKAALVPGAWAVIATFAEDGPERCSGLPVQRYSPESLARTLGPGFRLEQTMRHAHTTPAGRAQAFQYSLFRRVEG